MKKTEIIAEWCTENRKKPPKAESTTKLMGTAFAGFVKNLGRPISAYGMPPCSLYEEWFIADMLREMLGGYGLTLIDAAKTAISTGFAYDDGGKKIFVHITMNCVRYAEFEELEKNKHFVELIKRRG